MTTMTQPTSDLAASGSETPYQPFQLFAGDSDVVTNNFTVAPNTAIAQYQVLAVNTSGQLVPHAPAASDSTNKALYVAAQALASTANATALPVYVAGFFNHEALVWDASLTTLAARQAAFRGTGSDIQVGALKGNGY